MRFLVDENLSRRLPELLRSYGHEAQHVAEIGLRSASDPEVLAAARRLECILISADTDFGTLLVASGDDRPSVILVRRISNRRSLQLAALIEANLGELAEELEAGCVAVLDSDRIRVRRLPLG